MDRWRLGLIPFSSAQECRINYRLERQAASELEANPALELTLKRSLSVFLDNSFPTPK